MSGNDTSPSMTFSLTDRTRGAVPSASVASAPDTQPRQVAPSSLTGIEPSRDISQRSIEADSDWEDVEDDRGVPSDQSFTLGDIWDMVLSGDVTMVACSADGSIRTRSRSLAPSPSPPTSEGDDTSGFATDEEFESDLLAAIDAEAAETPTSQESDGYTSQRSRGRRSLRQQAIIRAAEKVSGSSSSHPSSSPLAIRSRGGTERSPTSFRGITHSPIAYSSSSRGPHGASVRRDRLEQLLQEQNDGENHSHAAD
ncbi:hypothetical protein IAU59_006308 [Kwoniella sp. CBS 9459]